MAFTIAFYTGDGDTTDFTVPFDYLAKKFVRVSLGVTILKGGDYGDTSKDYYFLDKTKVRLKVPPQVGEVLTIRRYTSATDRVVSFKDASVLKATDLDVSAVQTIHIAEEARDIINDALIKDKEGNWDAKGNRIVNVGDAVSDGDAVNLKLYKEDAKGVYQSRVEAEKARDRAVEAETNAKESEAKAKESETNSKMSETVAKASAGTAVSASKHADAVKVENERLLGETKKSEASAKGSANTATAKATVSTQKANEAIGYARDAKVSEDNAMASEVAAEGSAELAKQWATKLGATVDGVDYSAKHYANKANEILTQGATDAVNRVAQEGDRQISLVTSTGTTQVSRVTTEGTKQINLATAQANEATRQANLATAKATEAEADATSASRSATEADASAKNSANSASTATQQATLATQKATEAKNNADKAALSKDAAKVSETNAKKSEANAKVSETNAKESELKAKQYADQATAGQLQADWKQTDSTKNDFIKNKPTLGTLSAKNSLAYRELTGVPSSFTPSSHTHPISKITNLQASLDAKTNDADLQVDLTAIRKSITNVSSKVDGIGDTLSPTYAKKQAILDACDKALNGTNPVNAVDPTFINQLAEKLSKLGTIRPLGFHYLHPYGTVPADSIICNGATYSRALYKDFFDYITTQGWVKTEAEWQKIATRDNGFCPFYSSGDGSKNFRTPKFAPYQQIALASGSVGKYHQAGLPNITGSVSVSGGEDDLSRTSGTLVSSGALTASSHATTTQAGYEKVSGRYWSKLSISASNSNKTYGRSSTVQPESHEWVVCVVAYGIATNVGSVDIQNVMSAVNDVQASLTQIKLDIAQIPQPRTYVTKTWRSGTEWYRVWSDGFIEQGGHGTGSTCTFSKPFSNKNYTFNVNPSSGYTSHPDWIAAYENRPSRTETGTGISWYECGDQGWDWRASGY